MSRNNFLKNTWLPYPPVNFDAVLQGRILSMDHQSITVQRFLQQPLRAVCNKLKEGEEISVLIVGDWISIDTLGIVTLHAPALENPKTLTSEKIEILKKWSHFRKEIHAFFDSLNFLEIETPTLVLCPGSEPTLDVFSTQLIVGSKTEKLFLPTSPEWHLKKTLCMGLPAIYEIKSCFRNGEITERHQPEFLLLEWYRSFANLQSIKKDAVMLIDFLCKKMAVPPPKNIQTYSVAELFKKYLSFELRAETTEAELRELAKYHQVDLRAADCIDDCFYLIFMEKIECRWNPDELVFVENYPPYQAALARINPEGWGDRFEIYWKGYELANAFHELNNPVIQSQRFKEDLKKKEQLSKEVIGTDHDFFSALNTGLPPSGGIALGLERLFMAMHGLKDIKDLKLFPHKL